jgi:hypothetical protein
MAKLSALQCANRSERMRARMNNTESTVKLRESYREPSVKRFTKRAGDPPLHIPENRS